MTCEAVFTTIEAVDATLSMRVRKNGLLEPFQRDSILFSVYESLRHRKAATSDATALTATIVSLLYAQAANAVINRKDIVEITYAVLQRFDTAAAVHYRAFHPLES